MPREIPRLLTTREAAEALGLSARTLEGFRVTGAGPRFVKLGGGPKAPVRYPEPDLAAWIDAHLRDSTAEYGAA